MAEDETRTTVVYVLAPARSGTGILGRVLSTIDGVVFAGELRRLWSRGLRPGRTCACGRPHADCAVWSKLLMPGASFVEPSLADIGAIQRKAAPEELGWWAALRKLRLSTPPEVASAEGRYLGAYSDLITAFARVTGASVVVDSSKSAADAALLAVAPDLSPYVVEIVRDPRGVAFSVLKRTTGGRLSRHVLGIRIAARWVVKLLSNAAVRRRYGADRSLFVRYEDLIADPAGTVESVAKLLGRSAPIMHLAPGVPIEVPQVHGPDGNKQQKFVGTEIVLRLDDTWKQELPAVDRFLITLLTFPLLRRYGYPIRTGAS